MLLAQVIPTTQNEIIIVPVFLSLFGFLAWWLGIRSLGSGGKGGARILGGLLIGLAFLNGAQRMWSLYQPEIGYLYRAALSRRLLFAHYFAFLVPLVTTGASAVVSLVARRRRWDEA